MSAEEPSLPTSPVSGQNSFNSFPSVGELFRQSWETLKSSILNLFIFNIIFLAIWFAFIILILIGIFGLGVSSALFSSGKSLNNLIPLLFGGSVIFFVPVIVVISIVLGSIQQTGATLILDKFNQKLSFGEIFNKSFHLIIPLFVVSVLLFVIGFGGFFVFIIPAILFGFFFMFVSYEVILENKRWTEALKSSFYIVTKNFGEVLARVMLIFITFLLIGILVFFVSIALASIPRVGTIIQFLFSFVGVLIGWYGLSFNITLYKHAKVAAGSGTSSLKWVWVIAIIGWVIGILVSMSVIGGIRNLLTSNTFKQALENSLSQTTVDKNIRVSTSLNNIKKSISEMSPQAKVHWDRSQDLFKQMRAAQTNPQAVKKLNDENIAELKEILALEPNNARVWYELGSAYTWLSSGTLEDGLAAYKKAEELDPTNTLYVNGVGDMLIRMEKYDEAILEFQKTLRLTDKSGYANLSLGIAYSRLKVYDTAREHFKKAIEIFKSENSDGSHDEDILQAQKEMAALPK